MSDVCAVVSSAPKAGGGAAMDKPPSCGSGCVSTGPPMSGGGPFGQGSLAALRPAEGLDAWRAGEMELASPGEAAFTMSLYSSGVFALWAALWRIAAL